MVIVCYCHDNSLLAVTLSSNQKTLMNHQEAQDDAFSLSLSLCLPVPPLSLSRPLGGVLGSFVGVAAMTRVVCVMSREQQRSEKQGTPLIDMTAVFNPTTSHFILIFLATVLFPSPFAPNLP